MRKTASLMNSNSKIRMNIKMKVAKITQLMERGVSVSRVSNNKLSTINKIKVLR
jgi:hypothetical protein